MTGTGEQQAATPLPVWRTGLTMCLCQLDQLIIKDINTRT